MADKSVTGHSCVLALEENAKDVYLEITSLLVKLSNNVLHSPENPKFRSIRLSNPTIANKLLPAIGAMECLFSMGFTEGEDSLVLPVHSPLENMKSIRDEIVSRRKNITASPSNHKLTSSTPSVDLPPSSIKPSTSTQAVMPPQNVPTFQLSFLQKLENNFQSILRYEDKTLQQKALKLLPVAELEIIATKNLRKLQMTIKKGGEAQEVDIQDLVLIEMLNWFKASFFKWVDSPECNRCNGKTKFFGYSSDQKDLFETAKVEAYKCNNCQSETLFPRYNDPGKLLVTRRGRCGEWANCFTLFCRAMGWDARLVIDEADHVWTEVYSYTQGRWLHCDPCENVCDTPLMYEHGWGKKLSYVIAYSHDEIQDVTWRYSSNHPEILTRRTRCSEAELLAIMLRLKKTRQTQLSAARRAYLDRRLAMELVEFLTTKHPTGDVYGGRSSGSLAWRLARGETQDTATFSPYIWVPMEDELKRGMMRVAYSSSQNEYTRVLLPSDNTKSRIAGWQNGVFEMKDVFRKEEKDWKRVYLARTEGSDSGSVKWKFNFFEPGLVIDNVKVMCQSETFKTGKVLWLLCSGESCVRIDPAVDRFETKALAGATNLTLTAELTGGEGNTAWQHAQLFRQDADDKSCQLDITITFHQQ